LASPTDSRRAEIFSSAGVPVAILTAVVQKTLLVIALAAAASAPLRAQSWSVGGGAGPFIFGRFVERTVTINTETGSATTHSRLSAETRAGGEADIERGLNRWLALRLEGTWTRSPLRIKSATGDQGVTIDAGRLNLTTLTLPLVIRFNPNSALRFHVLGGPAYAMYNVHRRAAGGETLPLFEGTRGRWGGAGAVGAEWWWTKDFAVEWQAQEILTSSPFRIDDFAPASQGIHIPKPRNGHTTIGIRYRF
jgi:outer membrane protein with beta-barrel domain